MSKNKQNKSDFLKKCYKKHPNIVSRKIVDKTVLVPVMQKRADIQNIFTLNEVGSFIWELIDSKREIGEIKSRITKEFDVDSQKAEEDLIELINQLQKAEAIKELS